MRTCFSVNGAIFFIPGVVCDVQKGFRQLDGKCLRKNATHEVHTKKTTRVTRADAMVNMNIAQLALHVLNGVGFRFITLLMMLKTNMVPQSCANKLRTLLED